MQRKTNFFKRVFFSAAQEEFFLPLFILFFFRHRTDFVLNWTDRVSNVNRFGQSVYKLDTIPLQTDRRASGNSTYKKLAVQCSADSFVVAESFVLRINICGINRQLLVAANR